MDQLAAHEMNVFCRIIDSGSFAGAADTLGMTPSAVSKLVTRLEARLGVSLLSRTTRRLSLTGEGERYLRSAREIVGAIEAAEADLMANAAEPSGLLKINTGVVFGRHILGPILPEFIERYPKVSVELSVTDRQVNVMQEQVDIAIRTGPLADSSLVVRKIGDSSRAICASPAYLERFGVPASPSELAEHNCLLVSGFQYLGRWPFVTPEGVTFVEVGGNFSSDNIDVLVDMMLAGQGVCRLARLITDQYIESGELVELFTDSHRADPLPVNALMPPGGNRAPKIRAFLDFMIAHPLVRKRFS
jgi:DNA-binding transcriptional LysR family regulator